MPTDTGFSLTILPRFTTFHGAGTFSTTPIQVEGYSHAEVNVWRGVANSGGTFAVTCEESTDQNTWSICAGTTGGFDPGPNKEIQVVPLLQKRWFRLSVQTMGSGSVTCWAVGLLK